MLSIFLKTGRQGFFLLLAGVISNQLQSYELKWDWQMIDLTNISFPPLFLWGCGDSAWQTEGIQTANAQTVENSWTLFEQTRNIEAHNRVGIACSRWEKYPEDIQLLQQLGMNAYRFSVEWAKIEPEDGIFDKAAIDHYIAMIDEMIAKGITPLITLFHHTYPVWFARKGGFELKQNCYHFVRFALYVFSHLHSKVRLWITMNEPIGYAIEGYFRGVYPPGKKNLTIAGNVAKNLLYAHVNTYKELKKINADCQIGITHIFNPLDAYFKWNPIEQAASRTFDYLVNKTIIKFFTTGTFDWAYLVRGYHPDAQRSLDFFGINYYTHTTIKQTNFFSLKPSTRLDDTVLDTPTDGRICKVLYPEGLYRSIKNAAQLNVPLYITENGTSSTDPKLRNEYVAKHLYVISKALKDGFDVRGYFYWTLMDCFCWRKGYRDKYGIYAVNFTTQERTLREGNELLLETVKKFCRTAQN